MSFSNDERALVKVAAQIVLCTKECLCRAGATIGFIALARSADVTCPLGAAVQLCADSN